MTDPSHTGDHGFIRLVTGATSGLSAGSFAAGTRIAVKANAGRSSLLATRLVAVEDLRVGDTVITVGPNAQPRKILAIAEHRVDIAAHAVPARVTPLCVAANAIAEGVPGNTLQLPSESLLLLDPDGDSSTNASTPGATAALVPVGALANGGSIRRSTETRVTTWFTFQLACHAVVLAENLPVATTRVLPAQDAAKPRRARGANSAKAPADKNPAALNAAPLLSAPLCARLLTPGPTLSKLRARLVGANPQIAHDAMAGPGSDIAPLRTGAGMGPNPASASQRVPAPQPTPHQAAAFQARPLAAAGAPHAAHAQSPAKAQRAKAQLIVTEAEIAQPDPLANQDPNRPPLHLSAAGKSITATTYAPDGWFTFELPAGPGPVHLISPAGRAAETADPRKLGVPVLALDLDGTPIALTAPELGAGFHPGEGDGTIIAWRWTDGAATLILPKRATAAKLRIRVAAWHTNVVR